MTVKVVCLALLAAGFALAQDQPLEWNQQGEQDQAAENGEHRDLPVQLQDAAESPSILSRENALRTPGQGRLIGFRFYGEITGIYDSGLTPLISEGQEKATKGTPGEGMEAGVGIIGSRAGRHYKLSLEYKGRYRQYTDDPLISGTDQFLRMDYRSFLTEHVVLDFNNTLGTATLANNDLEFWLGGGTNFGLPVNEMFDNRTNYLQSRIDMTWDATRRLSFGVGGQGFIVRRDSHALAGLSGYDARSDIAYRITKHQTISASYEYASFDFQHTFGDAALQIAAAGYSVQFSRASELDIQAGTIQSESRSLNQIPLDPVVAAILGQTTAIVTSSRTIYLPLAELRFVRRLRRSEFVGTFSKTVSPGNGVYLTSRETSGVLSFSYAGYRRIAVTFHTGSGQLSPVDQNIGNYTNWRLGAKMTYSLARDAFLDLQYEYRRYTTQQLGLGMDSHRVAVGIAFSSGASPVTF